MLGGYLTAGDPDVKTSEKNVRTALENGVDVLELGVPFSDPTADGPIIQEASHRALAGGMDLKKVLAMVARLRRDFDQPIVLFGYANPFFRHGYAALSREAAKAGADGLLVVDLPFEEKEELARHLRHHGLFYIPLIAPTTPRARATGILRDAEGFVYYIMVRGVTGIRKEVSADLGTHVRRLRACTRLPIAVGFGVSSGRQARAAGQSVDGVVVGSALVQAAARGNLRKLVRELRAALG